MPRWIALCALAAMVLCTGCIVQSIHPLYLPSDTQFDPGLIGMWTSKEGTDRWNFASDDQLNYVLTYVDENGRSTEATVRLTTLDGAQFADIFPHSPGDDQNALAVLTEVPVHTVWRLERSGDELRLSPGSQKWLSDYLKDHPGSLPFEHAIEPQEQDWPLITASTDQLRAFISQHKTDDGLFDANSDDGKLTRMAQQPASAGSSTPSS